MNALATTLDLIGALIVGLGAGLVALSGLSMARAPDAMRAAHSLQLALGPGAGLVLLGLALAYPRWDVAVKLGLIWLGLASAGPLITSAIASAAHEEAARAGATGASSANQARS
jgi:multisubunit Na+/H+ antiporter MnhG subunit